MDSYWKKILAFTWLLIGVTIPDLAAATATASPNIQITVNVDTQSEVVFYWDLIQYASYNWEVQYQEGGAPKDMSSNSSAKLVAKLYEHAINGDTNTVFEVAGLMVAPEEGKIGYPIPAGLCDQKGKMRFEFQSYDGVNVSTRFYIDLFVVQGTDTGDNGGWTPPEGSDDYYTKPEMDAMLTYMAEWNQNETWNPSTKVDFYDATVSNALFADIITNLTGRVEFDDTEVYFSGASKILTVDPSAYFNGPVTMNNQLTVDSEATVESNMIINGTLDVTGANIIGNLVKNDVFEVKTPVAVALAAEASAAAVAGSMVFDDPVIFNSNVTANAEFTLGDVTTGNLTVNGGLLIPNSSSLNQVLFGPAADTNQMRIYRSAENAYRIASEDSNGIIRFVGEGADLVTEIRGGGTAGTSIYAGPFSVAGETTLNDNLYTIGSTSPDWVMGRYQRSGPTLGLHAGHTSTIAHLFNDMPESVKDLYVFTGVTTNNNVRVRLNWADTTNTLRTLYMGDSTARDYIRFYASGVPLVTGVGIPDVAAIGAGSGDWVFTNKAFFTSTIDVASTAIFDGNTYFDNDSYWQDGGVETVRLYEDTGRIRIQMDNTGTWGGFTITKNSTSDYGYAYFGNATAAPEGWGFRGAGVGRPAFCYQNNRMVINDYSPNFETGYEDYGLVVMNTGGAPGGAYISGNLEVVGTTEVGNLTVGDLTGSTDPWTLAVTSAAIRMQGDPITLSTGSSSGGFEVFASGGSPYFNVSSGQSASIAYFMNESPDAVTSAYWFRGGTTGTAQGTPKAMFLFGKMVDGTTNKYLRFGNTTSHKDYHQIYPNTAPLVLGSNVPTTSASEGDIIFTNPVFAEAAVQFANKTTHIGRNTGGTWETDNWTGGAWRVGPSAADTGTASIWFLRDRSATMTQLAIGTNGDTTSNFETSWYQTTVAGTLANTRIGRSTPIDYFHISPRATPIAIGFSDMVRDATSLGSGSVVLTSNLYAEKPAYFDDAITSNGITATGEIRASTRVWANNGNAAAETYVGADPTSFRTGIGIAPTATTTTFDILTNTAATFNDLYFFRSHAGFAQTRIMYGASNQLIINASTDLGYLRLFPSGLPLAIGGASVSNLGAASSGDVIFTTPVFFEAGVNGNLGDITVDSITGSSDPLTISSLAGTSLTLDTGFDSGEEVIIKARSTKIRDRTDVADSFNLWGSGTSSYFTKGAANPATSPQSLFFAPNSAGLGGDKGLTLVSWNANIGDARPGLQGCQYRWYIPRADGTSSTALQLGAVTSEDWLRLSSTNTATPFLFGNNALSTQTTVTTGDDVALSGNAYIEGDLEVHGEIIVETGTNDATTMLAYAPALPQGAKVVSQFGEIVLVGGSATVPLGLAYDGTDYYALALYKGAGAGNWNPIGYVVVDADHITFYGQTGETITYQTIGYVTP